MPFPVPRGSHQDGLAGEWFSARVPDGWLIGYNAGEFGAALWWFSPDGGDRYRISDDHVVGFIPAPSGPLAITGIAHGTTSRGQVIRFRRGEGGRWRSEPLADLGGAPEAAVSNSDGSLTVATHDRLLHVDIGTSRVDVLLAGAFWGALFPNSVAVTTSGTVYVGMRHGVARVAKTGAAYEARWLLPRPEVDRPAGGFR
jgi:hypothetical protein